MIGRDPDIKERVNYLSCIEGKGGGLKDIHMLLPRAPHQYTQKKNSQRLVEIQPV